jgi:hypothetical protein
MLAARLSQVGPHRAIRRLPGVQRASVQRTMAQLTVYVKGDPARNKLLDCEPPARSSNPRCT